MKIKVKISSQRRGEAKESFESQGDLGFKDEVWYITYHEPGLDNRITTLKIKKTSVLLLRFGEQGMRLEFKKDIKTKSIYKTPYGVFEMEILPDKVKSRIGEKKGEVYLEYMLNFAGEKSYNIFKLEYVKEEG